MVSYNLAVRCVHHFEEGALGSITPLANLPQDQQNLVYWIVETLESLPSRSPETERHYKVVDEALPTLRRIGIGIKAVPAWRKEIRTSIVQELDGQLARPPG